ncbi:MAG: hypothetical protein JRH17_13520 [Deltaproteobacteria bacterium]|nr:hypothetical protein [Deltaproteobacteria bacterium]
MTKTLLWLAFKFVAITAPATWWWMYGGGQQAYWQLYRKLAFPILAQLGVTTFPPGLVKDRLLSFLPFVALMLITPRLSVARRFGGMAIGIGVIFAGQVLLAWWAWWTHVRPGTAPPQAMSDFFPALILMDALPFVAWAAIASPVILDLLSHIVPRPVAAGEEPGAGTEESDDPESA